MVKNSSCHGFPMNFRRDFHGFPGISRTPTTTNGAVARGTLASFAVSTRSRLQGAHGSTDEPSPAPPAASATGDGAAVNNMLDMLV